FTQDEKDRRMVARLEELHATKGFQGDLLPRHAGTTIKAYVAAFQEYGLPIADLVAGTAREGQVEETVRRIAASPIHDWLVAGLAACAYDANQGQLLPIVRRVEEKNPWRLQFFDARIRDDTAALVRLARQPEALMQPPAILVAAADILSGAAPNAAVDLLRKAQVQHPADVRINMTLADKLGSDRQSHDESMGFYRAALAARPEDPIIYKALARHFRGGSQDNEAVAVYRQLIRLRSADVSDFIDFALLLMTKKVYIYGPAGRAGGYATKNDRDLDGAIAVLRKALEIDPKSRRAQVGLAIALRAKGDRQGADEAERKAAEVAPKGPRDSTGWDYFWFGHNLMNWTSEESEAAFRKAIELDPSCTEQAL